MIFSLLHYFPSFAQTSTNPGFDLCRSIQNDDARLKCLLDLALPSRQRDANPKNEWPIVRTPNPTGGPDAVSVLRTADIARSDAELAGLMIRCGDNGGNQILLALIRPFPPRTKKRVTLRSGSTRYSLQGESTGLGSALLLPEETTLLASGEWQQNPDLEVNIEDSDRSIKGYIDLDGLPSALQRLNASCPIR